MTREEIEDIIYGLYDAKSDIDRNDISARRSREDIDKAIKAIEALTKPNNTCEVDLISREGVMGAVQDHFNADGFKGYYDGQKMMDRITALPSAEAVQGEWIDVENEPYCECSVCGAYIDNLDDGYAFCPRCGAKMDKR